MSVFLRGPHVDVLAPDAVDPEFPARRREWLAGETVLPVEVEAEGDVVLAWAPARGGPTMGTLALARIDWPARGARLAATLAPEADRALAREALALVVRYAQEELGLRRLDARVGADDAATLRDLAALGFREQGLEPVGLRRLARIAEPGNR